MFVGYHRWDKTWDKTMPTLFNGIIVKLDWGRWEPLAKPSALSLPVSRILRLGWVIITLWQDGWQSNPPPREEFADLAPNSEGMWRITMHETTPELDISTKISQLEAALVSIKTRLHQVQQGEERYSQLQTASHALKRQLESIPKTSPYSLKLNGCSGRWKNWQLYWKADWFVIPVGILYIGGQFDMGGQVCSLVGSCGLMGDKNIPMNPPLLSSLCPRV